MLKLDQLLKQQDQLKARIQIERNKAKDSQRKLDTRRKILAGSIALSYMESDPGFKATMEKLFREKLTRDSDRKLFGLDPLKQKEE